jgi:hypothetical protein
LGETGSVRRAEADTSRTPFRASTVLVAVAREGKGLCLGWARRGGVAEPSERGLTVDGRAVCNVARAEKPHFKKP